MRSEAIISVQKNDTKRSDWELPVYLVSSCGTLYQVAKQTHNDKYVLMLGDGHIQASGEWDTIDEVLHEHHYLNVADVEIKVKVR